MPRALMTLDGHTFALSDYELPPLGPRDVRVRVDFAAPKHGTELHLLRGSAFDQKRWDPRLRIFLPREASESTQPQVRGIGNMVVGTVTEVGAEVGRWKVGDRVFGYGPVREVHQAPEEHWYAVGALSPEDCVCVDPAHVAFVAVRDGNIRIGDHVAVFGLGAIGLMAVQIARAGGARRVFAVDPSALRREAALALGAEATFNPLSEDVGLAIKLATDGHGVDVSIETSGKGAALHEAIRCIRQCGTVVHVPWGPHDCSALHLDEEFHLNRPTLVGSQAWPGWGCPDRSYPLWTHERAFEATIELFLAGLISGNSIVRPVISFHEAPRKLGALMRDAERSIKVGISFT